MAEDRDKAPIKVAKNGTEAETRTIMPILSFNNILKRVSIGNYPILGNKCLSETQSSFRVHAE